MIEYINGTPVYWKYETSGQMERAVRAYWRPYAINTDEIPELDKQDLAILREYILHWAKAPCHRNNPHITPELSTLLEKAIAASDSINSRSDISKVLNMLIELSIDPF